MTDVTLELGDFTLAALRLRNGDGVEEPVPASLVRAIRYYLANKDRGGAGWTFPELSRGAAAARRVSLRVSIDDSLWRSFAEEAARQGVTPEQLAVHAALYYAAERDAGRVHD